MKNKQPTKLVILAIVTSAIATALLLNQSDLSGSANVSSIATMAQGGQAANRFSATRGDYLSPKLREEVEQLKTDVASAPSTLDNGVDRALVLWKWSNAFAQQGGVLPVELPAIVALVTAQQEPPATTLQRLEVMDRFVRELQLREEQPTAIGHLTSDNGGPFLPGSFVTIEQTYHVGDMPIVPGGGFFIARHFMSNQGQFQTDDPQGDNYISIRSTNPSAQFIPGTVKVGGMHGGFRTEADGLVFHLEGATLTKRDTVTVTYGDRSGGSRGFQVQTYSNDAFPLPIYVDPRGNSDFLTLPLQPYKVVGGPVHAVHGFAPSVAKVGETIEVSVRSEDVYYNRASGAIPGYQVFINGARHSRIEPAEEAITLLDDIQFNEPGVYRFSFESDDGQIRGQSNPIWVQQDPQYGIFWGDTHGHCGFAEGQGTPEAFFEFGRDDARLDFLTHSEHDLWMDDSEWQTLIENVNRYNKDGEFIAILGYEWTVNNQWGGHHNVFFRDTIDRSRVPRQTAPDLSQLYQRLAVENDMDDVLIIPHAHQAGDWRISHPQMETLVEIMSMHGHFEWFGVMYLNHGHDIGFVAASDDHLSHPGYSTPLASGLAARGGLAAVLAPTKTRDAIFDAMKDLAAYATTGQRIILDVDLNGARMGTRTVNRDDRHLTGRVFGTAPLDSIAVIKNGKQVWNKDLLTTRDEPASTRRVELTFHSTNDPQMRDNPRGWRPWHGTLVVKGAQLKAVSSPALENRLWEFVDEDENEPNRVHFALRTRGSYKNLVLDLENVTATASIEVYLDEVRERTTGPSIYRPSGLLPEETLRFSLSESSNEPVTHSQSVDQFTDSVTLRCIRSDPLLDYEFEYTDSEETKPGDYYFVRVRQMDGGTAWSSPIWVGGFSTRY